MYKCEKCLDSPCHCGWEYRNMDKIAFARFICGILERRGKEEALQIIELVNMWYQL